MEPTVATREALLDDIRDLRARLNAAIALATEWQQATWEHGPDNGYTQGVQNARRQCGDDLARALLTRDDGTTVDLAGMARREAQR